MFAGPFTGLKDGEPVSDADVPLLTTLMEGVFPQAGKEEIQAAIKGRRERADERQRSEAATGSVGARPFVSPPP